MNSEHTLVYLLRKLQEKGLISAKTQAGGMQTLKYWIKHGTLSFRVKPHNNWRTVNDQEVEEIIKALSPGGSGKWHAQTQTV